MEALKQLKCLFCFNLFKIKEKTQKYCSQSCANKSIGISRKRINKCLFCSKDCRKVYCNNKCQNDYKMFQSIKSGTATALVCKRYLIYLNRSCSNCKNSTWNEKEIPLEIDHINGDSNDNRLENLRLLCPNCHAQTSTYKGKNKGKGRQVRKIRYNSGKSY